MIGEVLGGYRLLSEIGSGAMGIVYRAEAEQSVAERVSAGSIVALKVIGDRVRDDVQGVARFLREARVGTRIDHPNVVQTLDIGCDRGQHFLVMEYAAGQTLRDLCRSARLPSTELVVDVALQIARGLQAIHEAGILHRDLKPSNVMVRHDQRVQIMDLGVAQVADATRLTVPGAFLGTPAYASPEQLQGRALSTASDLYSLGALLVEYATGADFASIRQGTRSLSEFLALSDSLRAAGPEDMTREGASPVEVPDFLVRMIERLTHDDPEARYVSAAEVVRALDEADRPPQAGGTVMEGRDAEVIRLLRCVERLKAGEGAAVLVIGAFGIGKTELVRSLVRQASTAFDVRAGVGAYLPLASSHPAAPFFDALADRDEVESLIRTTLPPGEVADAMLDFLVAGHPQRPITPEGIRSGIVRVLVALARREPTVLIVEDLHYASTEAVRHFLAVVAAARNSPLVVVGTARSEEPLTWQADFEALPMTSLIELHPLSDEAGEALIGGIAPPELPRSVRDRIRSAAGGNPLFLRELVRAWGTNTSEHVPESLRATLRRRLDLLTATERQHLQIAACIGHEFDPRLLADAVALVEGSSGDSVVAVAQELEAVGRRTQIVVASGHLFAFANHLLRDLVYQDTAQILRAHYHQAVAACIERGVDGEIDGPRALLLVRQYLPSNQADKARGVLELALTHARSLHMYESAIQIVEQTQVASPDLDRKGQARLHRLHAAVHRDWGSIGSDPVLPDLYVGAANQADDVSLQHDAHLYAGQFQIAAQDIEEAVACFGRARAAAQRSRDVVGEARALLQIGNAHRHLGNKPEALQAWRDGDALDVRAEDPVLALELRGTLSMFADSNERAIAYLTEEARRLRTEGEWRVALHVLGNLALVHHRDLRRSDARACFGEAVEIARSVGERAREAAALGNLAVVTEEDGDIGEARDLLAAAIALSDEIGDRFGMLLGRTNLAHLETICGRFTHADEHLGQVERALAEQPDPRIATHAARYRGKFLVATGRSREALACFVQARNRAAHDEDRQLAELARARTLLRIRQLARAVELARRVEESCRVAGSLLTGLRAAAVALAAGQLESRDACRDGYERHRRALPVLHAVEVAHDLWRAAATDEHREAGREDVERVLASLDVRERETAIRANSAWRRLLGVET